MKKQFTAIAFVCAVLTSTQVRAAAGTIERVQDRVPDAYIVVLDAATPAPGNAEALTRRAGAKLRHVYDAVLNGFSIRGSEQQALVLSKLPGVVEVREVARFYPTEVMANAPNGLDRIDQRAVPLDTQFVFARYTTLTNVYVVDTGIDPNSEFDTRLVTNINFAHDPRTGALDPGNATDGGLPLNSYFHGTPNAVIAAGGQSGIARWAKIHNVRVCSPEICFSDDVIAGVNFVTQQRNAKLGEIHVANASFAGLDGTANGAFINSINAGVGWVFGAGNAGADGCGYHPASLAATRSGAMSVGASSPTTDRIYDYSNQGPCVEIFAPGATQWATWPGNEGGSVGGTSVAAPHVTGVFAAQWANSPTSNASEIEGVVKGVATAEVLSNRWATSPDLLLFAAIPRRRAVSH